MPAPPTDLRHALVLFSGGQDATACLARALRRDARVETIGFDAGPRHRIALDCRLGVRGELAAQVPHWAARLGDDALLDLRLLGQLSDTALTSDRAITFAAGSLPNTFVPGCNLLFFNWAAAVAHRGGASMPAGGMRETDDSGCPDCRGNTCMALQVAPSLGLETPLVWLSKAQTTGAAGAAAP